MQNKYKLKLPSYAKIMLASVAFALSGCSAFSSQHTTESGTGSEENMEERTYPEHPEIKPGMTRVEVYQLMGIQNDDPATLAPYCDNFSYIKDGTKKYTHVYFNSDATVKVATTDHNDACYIE